MSKPRFPTVLYLEGIDTLLKNKDRANVKIGRAVEKGLLAGGVHLRRRVLKLYLFK